MADVGKLANVSAQTVSRFFTGTGYVGADTRVRIEAAVAELDYHPSHLARAFRANRTNTIGVLTMGAMDYGVTSTYAGLTAAAHSTGYTIVMSHIDNDIDDPEALGEVRRGLDKLQSFQVDGLILATQYRGADELFEGVAQRIPVVTLSGRPRADADTVALDSYKAGLLATQHLIDLGHRRILHVAGPRERNETIERERGYAAAMEQARLPADVARTTTTWAAESGYLAGTSADPSSFTAVFAANDEIALGFMSALRSRGFHAPQDYSIVGVDDMPEVAFYSPPLTTVKMDFAEVGAVAFGMISRRIETDEREELRVIPSVLVERASTGSPRDAERA